MHAKRKLICVSTTKPTAALTAGGGGGSLTLVCPRTGSIQSSLRVAGDLSGKVSLGVSSLSTFPSGFSPSSNSSLAVAFGSTVNKKDDSYGMLFTLRTATLPPILHWKCRLPEAQMTAGLVVRRVYVWSAVGGALLKSIKAHYRSVAVMAWSTCGRHLITGGVDGMVHVFSLVDLAETAGNVAVQPIRTWTKHHLAVTAITPLGGGSRFASTSQDGQVVLLEIFSGAVLASIQLPQAVVSLAEKDNRLFAGTASGTIHIVDLDDYAMHRTAQLGATTVRRRQIDESHRQKVFGTDDNEGADETPYLVELHGHGRAVTALSVFSDEASSSSSAQDWLVSGDEAGTLRVWDLSARSCVRVVHPWSHSGSKVTSATTTANHPVTSINVLEESTDLSTSAGGLFAGVAATAGRNNSGSKNQSATNLITPLQRFAQQDSTSALAVPFLHPTRNLENSVWNVASDSSTFSFAAALSSKRQRLEQKGGVQIKRQPTDNKTSSSTKESEKISSLETELEEARATIERWESVNNKLMERLQQGA